MRKMIALAMTVSLYACSTPDVTSLDEVTSPKDVTITVEATRITDSTWTALSYASMKDDTLKAGDKSSIRINGTTCNMDGRTAAIIQGTHNDGLVIDINTADGKSDTKMLPDDLSEVLLPDSLVLNTTDNGVAIPGLLSHHIVEMRGSGSAKAITITKTQDGAVIIDPSSIGKEGIKGPYPITISVIRERRSTLSNGMSFVIRQRISRSGVTLLVQ